MDDHDENTLFLAENSSYMTLQGVGSNGSQNSMAGGVRIEMPRVVETPETWLPITWIGCHDWISSPRA